MHVRTKASWVQKYFIITRMFTVSRCMRQDLEQGLRLHVRGVKRAWIAPEKQRSRKYYCWLRTLVQDPYRKPMAGRPLHACKKDLEKSSSHTYTVHPRVDAQPPSERQKLNNQNERVDWDRLTIKRRPNKA